MAGEYINEHADSDSICERKPQISVIVPCYNGASTIDAQLEAFANQQDAPPFEIIIVDNRSTDDTVAVVEAWKSRISNLRIIPAFDRAGASYARNVGAASAASDLITFCDADDVVSKWWVKHAALTFEHAPVWSGSSIPMPSKKFATGIDVVRSDMGDSATWHPPVNRDKQGLPVLMGGNCGFLKSIYNALGGFDENLPHGGEDNDMAARVQLACLRVGYSRELRSAYRTREHFTASWMQQQRAAKAYVLLSIRYGRYYGVQPPNLLAETTRTIVAPIALAIRWALHGGRPDWSGLAFRWAAVVGYTHGTLKYRVLHQIPELRSAEFESISKAAPE